MLDFRKMICFEADKGGGGGGTEGATNTDAATQTGGTPAAEPVDFDSWFKAQPEATQKLLDTHTTGLKSALTSERGEKKELERQLRELAKKAESGSEAQKEMVQMADRLSESDRRTSFYETAHLAGVTNLKLAYLAATTDGLFDKNGNVNFEEMKKTYPQLFANMQKKSKSSAGEGTQEDHIDGADMNSWLRSRGSRFST